MPNKSNSIVATMGIDIGKNAFHVVGVRVVLFRRSDEIATPQMGWRRIGS
jgi:hypothetical protein